MLKYLTEKEKTKYLSVAYLKRYEGHGWFSVDILTEEAERLRPKARFFLAPPLLNLSQVSIKEVKSKGEKAFLRFRETDELPRPEIILKRCLQIPLAEAKKLGDDEYWFHEIIGLKCYTLEGKYLGEITSIMKTGANDVYFVDRGKYLIPAVKEVIKEVKVKEGKVIIEEIPGLLEL